MKLSSNSLVVTHYILCLHFPSRRQRLYRRRNCINICAMMPSANNVNACFVKANPTNNVLFNARSTLIATTIYIYARFAFGKTMNFGWVWVLVYKDFFVRLLRPGGHICSVVDVYNACHQCLYLMIYLNGLKKVYITIYHERGESFQTHLLEISSKFVGLRGGCLFKIPFWIYCYHPNKERRILY